MPFDANPHIPGNFILSAAAVNPEAASQRLVVQHSFDVLTFDFLPWLLLMVAWLLPWWLAD